MWADIYVLAPERTADAIDRFLDRFVPDREPAADDYCVPQFAEDPVVVFSDACELIRYCTDRIDVAHSIYWRNRNDDDSIRAGHAFFLADGGLILGLSASAQEHSILLGLLDTALRFVGSDAGYIVCETPPVDSREAFIEMAAEFKDACPFVQ